ncbi:MAG: hypothetical protein ACTSV2_06890 [Candidatus Thorarchaeota archaeon]
MAKRKVSVVQLQGCDRCAWHMLAFQDWDEFELVSHPLVSDSKPIDDLKEVDVLVLTGYAEESDLQRIEEMIKKAKTVVTFGTCPHTGGIFGLQNQRGGSVRPLSKSITPTHTVLGCPPSAETLRELLGGTDAKAIAPLCKSCEKTFQQEPLSEIVRLGTFEDTEHCFNNLGLPCNGVVSGDCTQNCFDYEVPCRGCVPTQENSAARMIGYFSSMTYPMVEVATVANHWATDKLDDVSDDLTESLVDIVGTFFRFDLASAYLKGGNAPSNGSAYSNILVGRRVEEAIQIAATVYGSKGISVALNLVEGYEKAAGLESSEQVKELREQLRQIQKRWVGVNGSPSSKEYMEITDGLRSIAGNEVMSNVFFCGFRTPISETKYDFDSYKAICAFEPVALESESGDEFSKVKFATDDRGIIREWSCEL